MFQVCFDLLMSELTRISAAVAKGAEKNQSLEKRPLEDVVNIIQQSSEISKDKRRVIEFDMARIDVPEKKESVGFKTHIPAPPVFSLHESKNLTEKNRRSSNIPMPQAKIEELDVRHLHKLMDIKKGLSKRTSSITPEFDKHIPELRTALQNSRLSLLKSLSTNRHLIERLDAEKDQLSLKIEETSTGITDLRRHTKKLNNKLSDLKQELSSKKKKFEFMEESVMKNVLQKEQLINIQIREMDNSLQKEYNDLSFELKNELVQARSYKDSTLADEIMKLKKKAELLQNQLEETTQRKQKVLATENLDLEKKLDSFLMSKTEDVDKATETFEKTQQSLQSSIDQIERLKCDIANTMEENKDLSNSISSLEHSIVNFDEIKSELERELRKEENSLLDLEFEDKDYNSELQKVKEKRSSLLLKFEIQDQQRRILENSIMDYDTTLRTYVKLPRGVKIINPSEFELNGRSYELSKCFGFNVENRAIFKEFEMLCRNSMSGTEASIVFSGKASFSVYKDFVGMAYTSIVQAPKEEEENVQISLLALKVGENILDPFDNCRLLHTSLIGSVDELKLFQNKVDSLSALDDLLEIVNAKSNNDLTIVILKVLFSSSSSNKRSESNVLFYNALALKCEMQLEMLKALASLNFSSSKLDTLLRFSASYTKVLNVQVLDQVESEQATDFVNSIVTLL